MAAPSPTSRGRARIRPPPSRPPAPEGTTARLSPSRAAGGSIFKRFRKITARRVGLALTLALATFALYVVTWRPASLTGSVVDDGYHRVAGVVHVHTTFSDGGGTPQEVIEAARQAGLAYLGISDHNNADAKPFEGYRQGVLVLVGTEISTASGHLFALGLRENPQYRFSGDVQDALEDVHALGGVPFAAHPLSPRGDFLWTGWDVPGPWGFELLNGDSQWREAGWGQLLRTLVLYGLNRRYALLGSLGSPAETLRRWDVLLRERDVVGIASADAHSRVPLGKRRGIRFPAYGPLFGLMKNHLLLKTALSGDAASDIPAVLEALRQGRLYVGLDGLASAGEFSFVAETPDGRRCTMGETLAFQPRTRLRITGRMPAKARFRLLHDGRQIAEGQGKLDLDAPGSGVYRVEARVSGWRTPWILSNPIYLFDAARALERERRAAWPAEKTAPAPAVIFDSFEGRTIFSAEHNSSSIIRGDVVVPNTGPLGGSAGRLAFRLASPTAEQPHPFCALVNREARDLRTRSGLFFWIKGDGERRIWVQLRDENPASSDDGLEWWFASARATPEWRRVALPFSRFRSINKKSDGRLDLDRVRQVVFVVDQGAMKSERDAEIWLDDVGAY